MKNNITYLKKQIIYRCSHTGIKETDIIYKKLIINNIKFFNPNELKLILDLLVENSDFDNFLILTKRKKCRKKYSNLINNVIF